MTYDPNYKPKTYYFVVGGKVIVENNEKILILQRSEKAGGGGLWSLPGGALEYGEGVYDAVKREVFEETQLEVKDIRSYAVKTHVKGEKDSAVIIGYVAKLKGGEIKLNWEHDDYKWVEPGKAIEYGLTPDAKYFISEYTQQVNKLLII